MTFLARASNIKGTKCVVTTKKRYKHTRGVILFVRTLVCVCGVQCTCECIPLHWPVW